MPELANSLTTFRFFKLMTFNNYSDTRVTVFDFFGGIHVREKYF